MNYYELISNLITAYAAAHGKRFEIKISGTVDVSNLGNYVTNEFELWFDKVSTFAVTTTENVDFNPLLGKSAVLLLAERESFLKQIYGELITAGY